MARVVVYTLLATAFLLFILYSRDFRHNNDAHRGLNRRFGYQVPSPIFDPLVIEMERMEEEKKSGEENSSLVSHTKSSETGQVQDSYDYFGDGGKLNITLRLMILFPMLDKSPKDGVVDFEELEAWNTGLAMDRLVYTTQRELVSRDKDGDGAISFREYLPQLTHEEIEKNGMAYGEAGWWKEQFINADVDKNGYLNFDEFKDFLHPEDSNNDQIHKWLLREKIKRMDYDKDGKLNFVEFQRGAYDTYKNYVEFESSGKFAPKPEEKFDELDVDKDKVLTADELKPILRYLSPGELSSARYFTNYLIHEADENRDGVLTLDEMLNHHYIFYSTVYGDRHEEDDAYDFHDEL